MIQKQVADAATEDFLRPPPEIQKVPADGLIHTHRARMIAVKVKSLFAKDNKLQEPFVTEDRRFVDFDKRKIDNQVQEQGIR